MLTFLSSCIRPKESTVNEYSGLLKASPNKNAEPTESDADTQFAQNITNVFQLPSSKTGDSLKELRQFQHDLVNGFAEKNIDEMDTFAESVTQQLNDERTNLKQQQHDEFLTLNSLQDEREKALLRTNFHVPLTVNDIKNRMVEQEHLIAALTNYPQSDVIASRIQKAHRDEVKQNAADFSTDANLRLWDFSKRGQNAKQYFEAAHSKQDLIAQLSSNPNLMQSYLDQQHKDDYVVLHELMNNAILVSRHRDKEQVLIDKKFKNQAEDVKPRRYNFI